jgi:hypothetical protein
MRYVEIQHRYVVPVPDAAPSDPEWDTICNAAVSIMEEHMQRLNPNMQDLRTNWETMPREFASVHDTPQTGSVHRGRMPGEEELRYMSQHGVNFVADIMGGVGKAQNPYEHGQRLFPSDHPLHNVESEMLKRPEPLQIEDAEVVRDEDEDDGA